jgi:hypothetical protein
VNPFEQAVTFLCPVTAGGGPGAGWHAVGHLGLLGVVLGTGIPLMGYALVVFRRTDPGRSTADR